MDRWDSRKLDRGASGADDSWQQAKGRDNWRGGGMRGSMDVARAGAGNWGGRGEGGQPELARSGSSAPKDNGRWVRDDDDWRARKQSGALPEPRYDWSDNRAPAPAGGAAAGGAAARGPPPGFGHERQPEWAEDGGGRPRMTAADIEAERLRMQEQWKKQGNSAKMAADVSGLLAWVCVRRPCAWPQGKSRVCVQARRLQARCFQARWAGLRAQQAQ